MIADATADLDVGFLVYCAGADPNFQPFLANPVSTAEAMIQRNCTVPLQLCHHFAPAMVERGSGGIVVFGSGAGFVGAPNMVAYGATKAFDMVFAEALWSELHDKGVDVLGLILGKTDTPALRRLEAERGSTLAADQPLPDAATVDDVLAEAFENLGKTPTWICGRERARRNADAELTASRRRRRADGRSHRHRGRRRRLIGANDFGETSGGRTAWARRWQPWPMTHPTARAKRRRKLHSRP